MTKTQRWLITLAVISSISPLFIIAFIIKLLPVEVPIINFSLVGEVEPQYTSRYNNLTAGLFCIVPLSIVLITKFIARKDPSANISPMLMVSIMLGAVFSGVVLYGGLIQIKYVQITSRFDFIGFACVSICLAMAFTGNLLPYKSFKSNIAIKNRHTASDERVWTKVHLTASNVQMIGFSIMAIPIAFTQRFHSVIFLGSVLAAYILWTFLWSFIVKNKVAEQDTVAIEENVKIDA